MTKRFPKYFLPLIATLLVESSAWAQEINTEYNRFEDKTKVKADFPGRRLDSLYIDYLRGLLICVYDGKPSQGDHPISLLLGLSSTMGRFLVDDNPRLIVIVDEERLVLQTFRLVPDTRGELREERIEVPLSSETMAKLLKGKSVEFYLVSAPGAPPITFRLTDADQKLLAAFNAAVRAGK